MLGIFLQKKDGEIVGRVAAIINHNANRDWGENRMRFGWLDFIDDNDVSIALMGKVEELAKEMGFTDVNGPFGFTDLDREGLLVDGFDVMGSFTTLYNFPYYGEHLEALGYEKEADWHQKIFDVPKEVPVKLKQFAKIIKEKYKVRIIEKASKKELRHYAYGLFETLNKSFVPLYGFTPLSEKQMKLYVDQFLPLINIDLICLIVNEENKVVAFAVTMPSLSIAMRRAKGKLFPFGFIHILKALKNYETIDMLMIGIQPEYQNKGLNALIFEHLNSNYIKIGAKKVITNPQLEDNIAVMKLFEYYESTPLKSRRCYKKSIPTTKA